MFCPLHTLKFEKVNFTCSFLEISFEENSLATFPRCTWWESHLLFHVLSSIINTNTQGHWLDYTHLMSQVHLLPLLCCCLEWQSLSPFVFSLLFRVSLYLSPSPFCLASSLPPLSAGNSILHSAADSVTSAVQKASQALNERGERLGRAEERTADMMNSAEQFAVTAHKVSPCASKIHITQGGFTVCISTRFIEMLTSSPTSFLIEYPVTILKSLLVQPKDQTFYLNLRIFAKVASLWLQHLSSGALCSEKIIVFFFLLPSFTLICSSL